MQANTISQGDTIAAVATPPGTGGLGIVRVSGPAVPAIAEQMLGALPSARQAVLGAFRDAQGQTVDSGIALYFPAPNSFTGEHVLELQGHGGQFVLQQVLATVLGQGARLARAGEFSERAFLNDKLDLVQAEAIADLIDSGTHAAARAAQRSLQGRFSERVHEIQSKLTALRVFVEAAIDFPDEEIDFLAESDVIQQAEAAIEAIDSLLKEARQGRLLRDGIELAIIGRPNAGKSSLLNALSGEDSAIVTDIPGTTRDVLRERIDVHGIPVHVIDTAGIRETSDRIEAEGVRRARRALENADLALLVSDVSDPACDGASLVTELPPGITYVQALNKCDLLEDAGQGGSAIEAETNDGSATVRISAKTGQGLENLRQAILKAIGAADQREGSFSARQRHVDALKRARHHALMGRQVLLETAAGELMAEELRLAQQALGEITGEMLADDLLGAIFSSFCIGK